ncbi:hypothetical protein [Nocardioides sp. CFH 31398]|uniref:hypothetical protein n=1 Tax=Nocardioides sp. CFH 31398 TaxID=2919579 RepID=UPI001F06E387|nr:hypothetical protein [Nocardioides sp. CFH 31398]MCH1867662.1 hypothetical protein [Nocardioides sp. CFH 31398]
MLGRTTRRFRTGVLALALATALTGLLAPGGASALGRSAEAQGKPRLDNSHTQPALVAYGAPQHAEPYARRGSLVIAGRENFGSPAMKDVSRAGGTVLVYLDPIIDNDYGRYHQMLNNPSRCGSGSTRRWPGNIRANDWGYLNDFRPGSTLQRKLGCVLRTIARENPHIGGFFADDVGSRSWFPGFDWNRFGAANQRAYRAGAIAVMKTFRRVADRFGLIVMVNGTWQGGSTAEHGGGYPNQSANGNALADGTFAENHTADAYWGKAYPCAPQWANRSRTTRGKHFNFAVTRDDSSRQAFARTGCYAFAATHQSYDSARVWGPARRTGLPHRVTRPR